MEQMLHRGLGCQGAGCSPWPSDSHLHHCPCLCSAPSPSGPLQDPGEIQAQVSETIWGQATVWKPLLTTPLPDNHPPGGGGELLGMALGDSHLCPVSPVGASDEGFLEQGRH